MITAAAYLSALTILSSIAGIRYPVMQRVTVVGILLVAVCLVGDRLT